MVGLESGYVGRLMSLIGLGVSVISRGVKLLWL